MTDEIQINKKEFIEILTVIEEVLLEEHIGQAKFINELKHILIADKIDQFIEKANAADMWGGAGAVWEVSFKDKAKQIKFAIAMNSFMGLLERAGIMGHGAKSLKEFFTNYNNL